MEGLAREPTCSSAVEPGPEHRVADAKGHTRHRQESLQADLLKENGDTPHETKFSRIKATVIFIYKFW